MQSEARVVVCLYDLALWFMQRTNRFPRNWRVTLGDRLDGLLLDMVLCAKRASLRPEKLVHLDQLSGQIEELRMLTRLASDLGCLEVRQYEYVCRQIDEIGRQVGGWIKHASSPKRAGG